MCRIKIVLILLSLSPFVSFSQSDTTLGRWIQIADLRYNHTSDEWIREPVKSQRIGPLYIHDTVYIDSLRIGLLNHILSLLKKVEKPKSPEHVILDSSIFTTMTISWRGKYYYPKKKKHKNTLDDYGGDTQAYLSQCPLDTVRGTILYNSAKDDNIYGKGMWIGCYAPYLYSWDFRMIPGKYLYHIRDDRGHERTIGSYIGRFYTYDNKHISNWRVYGLIVKYNIINLDSLMYNK